MEKDEEYHANWDVNRTDLDEINAKIEESKQYVISREDMEKNATTKPKVAMAWPLRVWLKKGKTYFLLHMRTIENSTILRWRISWRNWVPSS